MRRMITRAAAALARSKRGRLEEGGGGMVGPGGVR